MIYDYKCASCGHQFEVWAKVSDAAPSECPQCKSDQVSKVISAAAFALKGSGWYTTDYKRSGGEKEKSSSTSSTAAPTAGACGAAACGMGGCGAAQN